MRLLTVVFPAFNEAGNLVELVETSIAAAQASAYTPAQVRFVVVDNGSTDATQEVLQKLAVGPAGPWLEVCRVAQNQGYGHGLWRGLQLAQSTWVAWTHADLQCDPHDVFRALDLATASAPKTVVKGARTQRDPSAWLVTRGFEAWARVRLGLAVTEVNAQPKLFPRTLLPQLPNPPKSYGFDLYLLSRALRAGYQVRSLPVMLAPRGHGDSSWANSLRGRVRTMWRMGRYVDDLAREEGRL